ncbi:MAG: thrombospondin type 3 repeat-containing protein, partial [Dehalococcoidia bacterium]
MRRKVFLLSAGAAVVALLVLALGSQTPAAYADDSSMSIDIVMYEEPEVLDHCTNDMDNDIETGECPDVESNLWIDVDGDGVSDEEYFDLANTIWEVDGYKTSDTEDLDGDTTPDPGYVIPVNGLRATPGELLNLGATVGNITFSICGNVVPLSVVFANNVDDVAAGGGLGGFDGTVRGQQAVCGEENANVAPPFFSAFDIWDAVVYPTQSAFLVPAGDVDGDGNPDPQNDHFSFGEDCELGPGNGTPNGMPDAIDCTPDALIDTINAAGYGPFLQGRSYGIAELVITDTISTYIDINFLVFNLLTVPEVQGYLSLTVVQYPDAPTADPTAPGYKPTGQTVDTCPPYFSSPVHLYGVTMDSDFDGDTVREAALGGQINRQIVGDPVTGPYDYYFQKSTAEDWDGDTIANTYDRCKTDPQDNDCGGPAGVPDGVISKFDEACDDLDGDTLTGTCDSNEDATCPADQTQGCAGNVQEGGAWNTTPPWDPGQDADGDGYINYGDNCPTVADRDLDGDTVIDYQRDTDGDGVGDVCDPAPYIAGDGTGYPGSPGAYLDHDNHCVDQFSVGDGKPEPRGEAGAPPPGSAGSEAKYCYVAETFLTTQPYGNPALHHLGLTYDDSNDDGDPDWADTLPYNAPDGAYAIGEPIDTGDNTDNPAEDPEPDWDSDACEAVSGTDPLDPTSKSLGFLPIMDCDGDWFSDEEEEAAGTDPFNAASNPGGRGCVFANDADCDGCTDASEAGLTPPASSSDPWDWYDVPVTALGTIGSGGADISSGDPAGTDDRDGAVNIINDVLSVLEYSGTSYGGPPNAIPRDYDDDVNGDTVPDGRAYDRSVGATRTG